MFHFIIGWKAHIHLILQKGWEKENERELREILFRDINLIVKITPLSNLVYRKIYIAFEVILCLWNRTRYQIHHFSEFCIKYNIDIDICIKDGLVLKGYLSGNLVVHGKDILYRRLEMSSCIITLQEFRTSILVRTLTNPALLLYNSRDLFSLQISVFSLKSVNSILVKNKLMNTYTRYVATVDLMIIFGLKPVVGVIKYFINRAK